jgi:hypothetical protein
MQVTTIGLDIAKNVSGSRNRRGREGRRSQATSAQPGAEVLQGAAALPGWHGSLRNGSLLGAGADEARPLGAADAGEGREGPKPLHGNRIGGPQNFRPPVQNDFCDTIG